MIPGALKRSQSRLTGEFYYLPPPPPPALNHHNIIIRPVKVMVLEIDLKVTLDIVLTDSTSQLVTQIHSTILRLRM